MAKTKEITTKKSRKPSAIQAQGKLWVSSHYRDLDNAEEQKLEVQTFETEPAWIRTSYGVTINLGNYESARCDCGVTLPTYVEEIPEALEKAWALTEEQVQDQVKEINRG